MRKIGARISICDNERPGWPCVENAPGRRGIFIVRGVRRSAGIICLLSLIVGCAATRDFVDLKQDVRQEKEQATQRERAMQGQILQTKEEILQDQQRLEDRLDVQQTRLIEIDKMIARMSETSLKETKALKDSLDSEIAKVRVRVAELHGKLDDVRGQELASLQGKIGESQRDIQDLRLQLEEVSHKARDGEKAFTSRVDRIDAQLTEHRGKLEALNASIGALEAKASGLSKTLEGFRVAIDDLEKHRQRVETTTQRIIEKHNADRSAAAEHLEKLRTSLVGFEKALAQVGEQLGEQFTARAAQQDERVQKVIAQVGQLQAALAALREWVKARAAEVGEKNAADREAATVQLEKLRTSLVGFEGALETLGERLAGQVTALEARQDERVQKVVTQVGQLQAALAALREWMEARTTELGEKETADVAEVTRRLKNLGESLAGFEAALTKLGEGLAAHITEQVARLSEHTRRQDARVEAVESQIEQLNADDVVLQSQLASVQEAVRRIESSGMATENNVNDLSQGLAQLKAMLKDRTVSQ